MRTTANFVGATLALGSVLACSSSPPAGDKPAAPTDAPKTAVETYIFGTLRSGQAGIGGESTGWILEQSGGSAPLEVDVSSVLADARKLDGMMVSGWGTTYEKKYVERGPKTIFKFTHIMRMVEPTPAPGRR